MGGGTPERDMDFADAAEITHQCTADKAEDVENRNNSQIVDTILNGKCVTVAYKQADARFGEDNHQCSHSKAKNEIEGDTIFHALFHAVCVACTFVLGYQNGNCRTAAVTERVGETFDTHGRGVGGDARRSESIDCALHQNFSDIEAGCLHSGGHAVF